MVGGNWQHMWEDGQAGILQCKSTSSVAVRTSTELADSSNNPQLSDNRRSRATPYKKLQSGGFRK